MPIIGRILAWITEQLAAWEFSSVLKRVGSIAGSAVSNLGSPTKTALFGAGVLATVLVGAYEHHKGYEEAVKGSRSADAQAQIETAKRDAAIQRDVAATVAVQRDKLKRRADALQKQVTRYEATLSRGDCTLNSTDIRRLRAIR